MKLTPWVTGRHVRIKDGWDGAGRLGRILCRPITVGQIWVAVLWDGEDDPDWFKAKGLEKYRRRMRGISKAERLELVAARMRAKGITYQQQRHTLAILTRWHGPEAARALTEKVR